MIGRALVCLAALLWPGLSPAACVTRQLASVPLEIVGAVVLAPVVVNAISGTFILDTGSSQTVVTPDAVGRFDLALDEWTATTMRGVGGIERRRNANPRSIELGGVALRRRSLARDMTLRVGTLPRSAAGEKRIDGLLGRDFLSVFDLDVDFPHRTLTLYDVRGCIGRFLPWPDGYLSVPVENPAESALVVPVELDGVPLRALLDSGASRTLVAAPGMARLGLGLDRLRNDPSQIVSGMGPHAVTVWQHRFRELRISGETFADPGFLVTPIQIQPVSDMLLGADWLLGRRIWISYATNQLFMSRSWIEPR
jgi:predicted aspartyl protease